MGGIRPFIRKHPQVAMLGFGMVCALLLGLAGALTSEFYLRRAERNRKSELEVHVEDVAVSRPKLTTQETLVAPTDVRNDRNPPVPTTPASVSREIPTVVKPEEKPKTVEPPVADRPRSIVLPKPVISNNVGNITPENRRIYIDEPAFGYVHIPGTRATEIKRKGQKEVYRGTYTIDSLGRRVTPQHDGAPPDRAVLFTGCSYVFGQCVNDEETMPWQFALQVPDSAVYNYGVSGYGPQHLVELFNTKVETEVPQKKALVIYTFIRWHFDRAVGTPKMVREFAGRFPWYEIDEATQRPVRKGTFLQRNAQPSNSGSKLLDAYRDYRGETITKKDAKLVAALVEEGRALFEKKFQSEGFYFLVYPGRQIDLTDDVITLLKQGGTKILDYRNLLGKPGEYREDDWFIPGDGHPNPALHKKVTEQLVKDLSAAGVK